MTDLINGDELFGTLELHTELVYDNDKITLMGIGRYYDRDGKTTRLVQIKLGTMWFESYFYGKFTRKIHEQKN